MRRSGRRGSARRTGWMPAAFYALALHAVLIALLVIGFRIVSRDQVSAPVMQAVVVVREPSPEQDKAQQQARKDEERKRREAEQQRVVEEQQRQESERKKREEEQKKQADTEKKKQEAAERKKVEKQRQQQAEQALREQLADEEKAQASARSAKRASEADKYKAAIRQKVERNWVRPTSSRKGLQCTVRVRLIPGGEVLEAKVVRSSGDPVFDRSVESAVHKSSPLPLPEDADLFEHFREIEFVFRPED